MIKQAILIAVICWSIAMTMDPGTTTQAPSRRRGPGHHRYCERKNFPEPHCHEIEDRDDCPRKCTHTFCNDKANRLCSAFVFNRNVPFRSLSVDPFKCNERKCLMSFCEDCGSHQHCIQTCEEFKDDNGIPDHYFPDCNEACDTVQGDYKCFTKCPNFENAFLKPRCSLYPCSRKYCDGQGKKDCSAIGLLVNPLSYEFDRRCVTASCKNCGFQEDCVAKCEKENADYINQPGYPIPCEGECATIEGYKCFHTKPE